MCCFRDLIQTCLPYTLKTVIIVGFCNVMQGTPGRYVHSFRAILAVSDLFCPLPESYLLGYKAGFFNHDHTSTHESLQPVQRIVSIGISAAFFGQASSFFSNPGLVSHKVVCIGIPVQDSFFVPVYQLCQLVFAVITIG